MKVYTLSVIKFILIFAYLNKQECVVRVLYVIYVRNALNMTNELLQNYFPMVQTEHVRQMFLRRPVFLCAA